VFRQSVSKRHQLFLGLSKRIKMTSYAAQKGIFLMDSRADSSLLRQMMMASGSRSFSHECVSHETHQKDTFWTFNKHQKWAMMCKEQKRTYYEVDNGISF
jgi:hypothetical protein